LPRDTLQDRGTLVAAKYAIVRGEAGKRRCQEWMNIASPPLREDFTARRTRLVEDRNRPRAAAFDAIRTSCEDRSCDAGLLEFKRLRAESSAHS